MVPLPVINEVICLAIALRDRHAGNPDPCYDNLNDGQLIAAIVVRVPLLVEAYVIDE